MCVSTSTQTDTEQQQVVFIRLPRKPRVTKTPEEKAQIARDNAKRYYEQNREKVLAYKKVYYEENVDTLKEKFKQIYKPKKKVLEHFQLFF